MTALRLEDFAEWPVGSNVGQFTGTDWANGGATEPLIAANANYFSGKTLRWSAASAVPAQLTVPVFTVGATEVFSLAVLRETNQNTANNISGGVGWRFQIGANSLRIVCGSTGGGDSDTYILQSIVGAVLTDLARTPNIYPTGVKTSLALRYDPTTGGWEFYAGATLLGSGAIATFINTPITAITIGRLGTGAINNACNTGDLFIYENSAYLGPREIRSGIPNANDTNQDWAFVGGASAWESINNGLVNPPTQYIESGVAGQISDFDTPVSSTNVFGISAMELRAYATRTDVGAVSFDLRYGDAGSFFNGVAQIPPQLTYQFIRQCFDLNPNTGLGFTLSDMANARWGVERN